MKTTAKQLISLLTFACMMAGCSTLHSNYYPGEKVQTLDKILPEESIWTLMDECVYHVRRTGSNAVLIAGLDWNNKAGEFELESVPVVISQLDDQIFLSFQDEDKEGLYTVLRVIIPLSDTENSPDKILLFTADTDRIKRDAKADMIDAHGKGGGYGSYEIVLEGTKAEQNEYFRSNPNAIWDLNSAMTLQRVSRQGKDRL